MRKRGPAAIDVLERRCLFAGVTFTSATIPTGPTPANMVSGDFNGDGKQDVVVVNVRGSFGAPNGTTYGLSLIAGNGDGTFAAPVFIYPRDNQNSTSIHAADLNSDGKPDVVISDAVLINNGAGQFTATTRPTASSFNIGDSTLR